MAFAVLWEVVGILLAFTGLGVLGMSLLFNPLGSSPIPWVPQVSGMASFVLEVVLIAFGVALALLGFLAELPEGPDGDDRGGGVKEERPRERVAGSVPDGYGRLSV